MTHDELLQEHEAGATYGELAAKYNVTDNTIKGRVRTAKVRRQLYKTPAKPDLFDVQIGKPWELTGDWMIIGDVHVPTTDYDFSVLPAAIAKKHLKGKRRLLIAGDLFNMDEFSKYDKLERTVPWHQERDAARQLFHEWMEVFDEIYFLMGNHDRRLQKWTNGALDASDLISLVISNPDRVKWNNFGWCTINTPHNYPWRVTHPKNYSINQLTVADTLAQKFQCNIISHHEHHLSIGLDRYKRYTIVNNGGLFKVENMSYVQYDDTKGAGMAQGFTLLKDGYAHIFGDEKFTDYGRWL